MTKTANFATGMKRRLRLITILMILIMTPNAMAKPFTVVIDAGHGGKDTGAPGKYSKEKDINLAVALAFGQYVEQFLPQINVIYTRRSDVFVTLRGRAEMANHAKADLFISIHTNATEGGNSTICGFQTYTLGDGTKHGIKENLEVAKRENSVIFLESDYKEHYIGFDPNSPESNILFEVVQDKNMQQSVNLAKIIQRNVCLKANRQDKGIYQSNLAVLRLTSMPGCLVELGFITTAEEEAYLNSKIGQDNLARGLFNAFQEYVKKYDKNIKVPYKPDNETQAEFVQNTKPAVNITAADDNTLEREPVFKVQIFTNMKLLRPGSQQYKGLNNVDYYEENNIFKYTCGASNDYYEIYRLRKQLLEKFPDAFIIAFRDNEKINVSEAIKEFKTKKEKKK